VLDDEVETVLDAELDAIEAALKKLDEDEREIEAALKELDDLDEDEKEYN
jgi:chaperonin cofactor prefoldin